MTQRLSLISVLVPSYREGLDFFCGKLGWSVFEDTDLSDGKRWVRVGPDAAGTQFLLAQAEGSQSAFIGHQGGGRVWLFLETDDFERDFAEMSKAGVVFEEAPRQEPYGTVAVFRDPFGNRWDLIQYAKASETRAN